jgi:ABC-type anion transport system duplicated permease subunit
MFIGLILSVLFTFVYATAAARLRRAEKVLVPLLDILQSVPVLGFLTVTVTVMSVYVVGLNRLLWRRLYHLAETRYSL